MQSVGLRAACAAAALGFGLLAAGREASASAHRAGEVDVLRGVVVAQALGEAPRVLARGQPVHEGDRITVAPGSGVVLRLDDGTRLTLRPDTELVLRTWRFSPDGPDSAGVLELLRGGLRALTGAITRQSPDAARIHTPVATIGIRGTDFVARLCAGDCRLEPPGRARAADVVAPIAASARVVQVEGRAEALDAVERRRRLVPGSSLYPGDRIETAVASLAVLAFRDTSRITVGASSRMRLDEFRFDAGAPGQGRQRLSLARGTLRALTGLIARADPGHVGVATPTATLGVRGTGFDMACTGACADEAGEGEVASDGRLRVCTWRGAVEVSPAEGGEPVRVDTDECIATDRRTASRNVPPLALDPLPRPDTVAVPADLFTQAPLPAGAQGLVVHVVQGHLRITGEDAAIDLGHGESAFSSGSLTQRTALDDPLGSLDVAPPASPLERSELLEDNPC